MSGRWLHLQSLINPALHLPMRIPTTNILKVLFQPPPPSPPSHTHTHPCWRRDALRPPQIQRGSLDRNTCVHISDGGLRCVTWNTGGLIGSVSSSRISRELKHNYFRRLIENNNIICLQEVHGKGEFLQAIQVLAPRFRLYGTLIPGNENVRGSAMCIHRDVLPDDAVVTHVITCQGRDHIRERTVRTPKPCCRQRPLRANPEELARETMSHQATLALRS